MLRSKRRVLYTPPPSSSLSGPVMPRMSCNGEWALRTDVLSTPAGGGVYFRPTLGSPVG